MVVVHHAGFSCVSLKRVFLLANPMNLCTHGMICKATIRVEEDLSTPALIFAGTTRCHKCMTL